MTTVLKINLQDLTNQAIQELKQKFGKAAELEIRVREKVTDEGLLTEEQFWQIVDSLDWSKKRPDEILAPTVKLLAAMPVANIYLFADKLAEKLWQLDTKAHAKVFETDISGDDFLYARCAVIAEGKTYFEKVLKQPSEMPLDITFESLLHLAADAYKHKTGKEFVYQPAYNYETQSNLAAWN